VVKITVLFHAKNYDVSHKLCNSYRPSEWPCVSSVQCIQLPYEILLDLPVGILRHFITYFNLKLTYIATYLSATLDSYTSVRLLGQEHLNVRKTAKCRH
jgi:hypothetical protein